MSLSLLTEPLGRKRAAHLLRRTCFGASIADIDIFAQLTPSEAFARLYDTTLPDPDLPIDPETGMEWVTTGTSDANSEDFNLQRFLEAWQIRQMLAADVNEDQKLAYSFRERITFFMHTLFTTKSSVVGSSRAIYFQNALFRKYAFDRDDWSRPNEEDPELPDEVIPVNFVRLTNKMCVDNAMLVFLDGRLNVKGSPNENFARELIELYSIGRGLEGNLPQSEFEGDYFNYTETDVQQAARVLSGFNVDNSFSNIDDETDLPRGVIRGGTIASSHDNGAKVFSERFDNAEISPDPLLTVNGSPTEESLLDEIAQLIDLIYSKNETAVNICRRLYRFFVYHQISEAIQNDIIQDMADVFIANEFKLYPVLEALFTSREFYEGVSGYHDDFFGSIIKSPIDLTIGFIKNFEIAVPDYPSAVADRYGFSLSLLGWIGAQGMDYYEPYEVAGYPAYHQYPIYNRSWITTNYLTQRYDFVADTLSGGVTDALGAPDLHAFVKANIEDSIARDAKSLIVALAEYFLPISDFLSFENSSTSELTQERLSYFLDAFLYQNNIDVDPEAAWTARWDGELDLEVTSAQLMNLFNALLQSPEYQLM